MVVILDASGLLFKGRIIAQGDAGGDPVKGFFKVSTALPLTSMVALLQGGPFAAEFKTEPVLATCLVCKCGCAWQGILALIDHVAPLSSSSSERLILSGTLFL